MRKSLPTFAALAAALSLLLSCGKGPSVYKNADPVITEALSKVSEDSVKAIWFPSTQDTP